MAIFARRSVEEYTDSLAAYMPGGELFAAARIKDTNFRKLLTGIAWELYRANGFLRDYTAESTPATAYKLLDEWEETLGIPDTCFLGTGTVDERRQDVLIKLASLGVQTVDDFTNLATLLGLSVTVKPAAPHAIFPMTFPILFVDSPKTARFTILVEYGIESVATFPLTFPIVFGSSALGRLECLFRKLKPANCDIIFRQVVT